MSEEIAKELADRFMNDSIEIEIRTYVKADDIRIYPSKCIAPLTYIKSNDISVEINLQAGYCEGDFQNNKFTIIAIPRFY